MLIAEFVVFVLLLRLCGRLFGGRVAGDGWGGMRLRGFHGELLLLGHQLKGLLGIRLLVCKRVSVEGYWECCG